jgi:hypothetical protein
MALITGGNRGLGRAAALARADAGTDIVITYRSNHEEATAGVIDITAPRTPRRRPETGHTQYAAFPAFAAELATALTRHLGPELLLLPRQKRRRRGMDHGRPDDRRRLRHHGRSLQGSRVPHTGTAPASLGRGQHRQRLDRTEPLRRHRVQHLRLRQGCHRHLHPVPRQRTLRTRYHRQSDRIRPNRHRLRRRHRPRRRGHQRLLGLPYGTGGASACPTTSAAPSPPSWHTAPAGSPVSASKPQAAPCSDPRVKKK